MINEEDKKKENTMQVNLSGHHVDITPAVKEHVKAKTNKVASHYPGIISMTVILGLEKNDHSVEINTTYEGVSVSVSATEENLYSAIAAASKKLDAALRHRKGILKAKQNSKPILTSVEAEALDEEDEDEFIESQEAIA